VASRRLIDDVLMGEIEETMIKPTVQGLQADGLKYRGFLYFGLMLTRSGPRLLEYNCRFGDPEAEAVMPLVRGDFASYVFEGASGNLKPDLISFDDGWSVCLILASAGYPISSRNGDVIRGLEEVRGARVYHAGTKRNELGEFVTNGGRVLAIVHQAPTRVEAVDMTYWEAGKVDFDGCQRRSDIGRLHFD
jgi:phosphoribosylamine--glycine ligase